MAWWKAEADEHVWFTCPRCRLPYGTPIQGDDYARRCMWCGKQWQATQPATIPDRQRMPPLPRRLPRRE